MKQQLAYEKKEQIVTTSSAEDNPDHHKAHTAFDCPGDSDDNKKKKLRFGRFKKMDILDESEKAIAYTFLLSTVVSVSAGITHGVCDAQNKDVGESLEKVLTWGPMIVYGSVHGMQGVARARENEICAPGGFILFSGVLGGLNGLETLMGYGIGYGVTKLFS